jgi:hypothetical protein
MYPMSILGSSDHADRARLCSGSAGACATYPESAFEYCTPPAGRDSWHRRRACLRFPAIRLLSNRVEKGARVRHARFRRARFSGGRAGTGRPHPPGRGKRTIGRPRGGRFAPPSAAAEGKSAEGRFQDGANDIHPSHAHLFSGLSDGPAQMRPCSFSLRYGLTRRQGARTAAASLWADASAVS